MLDAQLRHYCCYLVLQNFVHLQYKFFNTFLSFSKLINFLSLSRARGILGNTSKTKQRKRHINVISIQHDAGMEKGVETLKISLKTPTISTDPQKINSNIGTIGEFFRL